MPLKQVIKLREELYLPRTAKNKAFEFIPAALEWQLDIKWKENLSFIHDAPISLEQKEDMIAFLAFRAVHFVRGSFIKNIQVLKLILNNTIDSYTPKDFEEAFDKYAPDSYKSGFKTAIRKYINQSGEFQSQALNVFYLNQCESYKPASVSRKHLDPEVGAHTPTEFDSIMEGMRLLTQKMNQVLNKERPFYAEHGDSYVAFLQGGMLWVLMISILRRPIQLRQIKMGDFRTVNGDFDAEFNNADILMDYDELKLQTYRAKNSLPPRTDLDLDLHLLNRKHSQLIMKFSIKLFQEQLYRLNEKGITLTELEKKELFKRYPLFPSYNDLLCSTQFDSKEDIFSYLSSDTLAGHITKESLEHAATTVANDILRPAYFSERVPNPKKNVTGNNRIRHTVLTSMAREGVDAHTLAAITGVSVSTVRFYVDMTPDERLWIDETLGKNAALADFGKVRIQDQMNNDDDVAFNEYGEAFGAHEESTRCSGCREVLPVPLSCYGCDNFNAFSNADHQSELNRATKKYEYNIKNGQSEQSLKRLKKAIDYIAITIKKCQQYKQVELGKHD
ncbi:hypothetical protein [Vibrio gallaecicus]|uniref:Site-specific integrase n=1 Tax=Vibrio gallaecicus TaxID=552386 RepID=A0ABV4NI67_9VIBR